MTTAVLGAGVIGVATAYWLAKAGEDVVVVERAPEAASDTSRANTGMITPSQSAPWAGPGMPGRLLRAATGRQPWLRLRPLHVLGAARWGVAFLGRCNGTDAAQAFAHNLRLSRHSQRLLATLRQETGIAYDRTATGTLRLFWSGQAVEAARATAAKLEGADIPARLLTPEECLALEPALAPHAGRLAGGLHCPGDETGDCALFTHRLAEWLARRGVKFRYGASVTGLRLSGGRVTEVATDGGPIAADRVVVALGRAAAPMLRPLGIRLPIVPVRGYSLTVPVDDPGRLPRVAMIDEARAVGLTPMGDRLRVGGFIDVAGDDPTVDASQIRHMLAVARDICPACLDGVAPERIRHWACLRPLTPDGSPILGRTPVENLFVNAGHGSHGWTMACGSGQVVADIATGRSPEIDLAGLTCERFGG